MDTPNDQTQSQSPLQTHITTQTEELLHKLGFGDASPEHQQMVLNKIQEMVDIEILYTITTRLNDDQINQLDEAFQQEGLTDDQKGQWMVTQLKEMLPDYEDIVGRAIEDLYDRIQQDVNLVKAFMDANPPKGHPNHPAQQQ